MNKSIKKEILREIYGVHDQWLSGYTLACQKGCADCCTQSVTMTALEGSILLEWLENHGYDKVEIKKKLAAITPGYRPHLTTNGFAGICLAQGNSLDEEGPSWDLTPCLFLADACCTVYPVRPFACRSFVSKRSCAQEGAAEIDQFSLSLNTVIMQIIEHLDQGGSWGNMVDVLMDLAGPGSEGAGADESPLLLNSRPLPGFLLMPEEEDILNPVIEIILNTKVAEKTVREWLFP